MFETKEEHSARWHQPVRVPIRKADVFGAAKELCEDLDGWDVVEADEASLRIQCQRANGFLGGKSRIEVRVEGPDDIPSSVTHVRSESEGGLLNRDKSNVAEFVKKFTMRVC